MHSYQLKDRKGVRQITWEEYGALSRKLAENLARAGVQAVVGIARGGLFPATAVACALRCEMYPVRATRRINDQVMFRSPVWRTPVPSSVAGKVVAVVDEIVDTGETLNLVAGQVRSMGASRVITACLVSHSWAKPQPDFSAITTDALVIFPWERSVLVAGQWQLHPEIEAALPVLGAEVSLTEYPPVHHAHVGAYGVCCSGDKLLVIKKSRGPYKGQWDLPGGGIEFGETPEQAVVREFAEETGLSVAAGELLGTYSRVGSYVADAGDRTVEVHHMGFIYRVNAPLAGPVKGEPDGQDSLGAVWLPIAPTLPEALSPLAARAVSLING